MNIKQDSFLHLEDTFPTNSNSDYLLADKIKHDLKTKIIGREIITLEHTESTMDYARQLLDKGVKEGVVVFAEQQTKGRGRSEKVWVCPKSKGLLLTVVLRPAIPSEKSYFLVVITAVATVKTIRDMFKLPVEINWPNDLVINEKKLGGILIETRKETKKDVNYIVGIGINVNLTRQEIPKHINKPATSLAIEREMFIDRTGFAKALLQNLDLWYSVLKEERYEYIAEEWQEFCTSIGKEIVIMENSQKYSGKLVGISDRGELILLLDNGLKKKLRVTHVFMKHGEG